MGFLGVAAAIVEFPFVCWFVRMTERKSALERDGGAIGFSLSLPGSFFTTGLGAGALDTAGATVGAGGTWVCSAVATGGAGGTRGNMTADMTADDVDTT